MTPAVAGPAFVAGAVVSLSSSWLLASRLERVGERLGLNEALLGVLAALAGDAPEITSAVTAIGDHQSRVGAGVVLGSSVFNLAALLGMGAALAGPVALHRRVVALSGCMSVISAAGALIALSAPSEPGPELAAVVVLLAAYIAVLGTAAGGLGWLPLGGRARRWLVAAVTEEEAELAEVLRPDPGRSLDALVAVAALVVVVVASVVMEKSAVSLGSRLGVPQIVIGALVLGWVTGVPNVVASTFLARRGRGAAALSTALNTNNFNVAVGLLLPAVAVGLGHRSGQTLLVAGWCLGLTLATLAWAYRSSGMGRRAGVSVIAAYVAFAVSVVVVGTI